MAADGEFIERLLRASDAVASVRGENDPRDTRRGDGEDEDEARPDGAKTADGAHAAAVSAQAEVSTVVAEWVPELLTSLERDRAAGTFARWGLSTVNDENVGHPLIGRPIFEFLHRVAAIECDWPIGNAGVLHTYGYLLSAVATPFGYKRERWIGDELTSALGMPADAFLRALLGSGAASPAPGLLTRLTDRVWGLLADTTNTSAGTDPGTIIRAVVDEFAGEEREEIARAVLVESTANPNARAVVYAVLLGESTHLITAFPVTATPAEWLAGVTDSPPRLRYNAAAHELPPRSALVSRRIRSFE